MATAEVLLIKPVEGLGAEGDEAKVKAGYARNYLVPQKLAVPLTASNRKQIESLQKARAAREAREVGEAEVLKGKIESIHIAVQVRVGEEGKMFGAVTAQDIYDHITKEGIEIDKKKVQLPAPIKALGKHTTQIKLHPDVVVDFEFEVVPLHEDEE
ncbi:MAG: 50S ribosomal protein L9 [Verrucomicrobiae bacterium]|nr:50S ribosomal protein L9 [Verrucomicrobiae bacterium]